MKEKSDLGVDNADSYTTNPTTVAQGTQYSAAMTCDDSETLVLESPHHHRIISIYPARLPLLIASQLQGALANIPR